MTALSDLLTNKAHPKSDAYCQLTVMGDRLEVSSEPEEGELETTNQTNHTNEQADRDHRLLA